MYSAQPIGPRKSTITTQPVRGPNGQPASGRARHGPLSEETATWSSGKAKPTRTTVQARRGDTAAGLLDHADIEHITAVLPSPGASMPSPGKFPFVKGFLRSLP